MILHRLRILGLLGLQDLDVTFEHPVTVVTGGPASGKTTLLLAIVSAVEFLSPSGAQGIELFSDPPKTGVKVGFSFHIEGQPPIDAEIIADSPMHIEFENPRNVTQVFAWNHNRRLVLLHENRHIDPTPGAPTTSMLREPTSRKHVGIAQFLSEIAADAEATEQFQLGLSAVCPSLRLLRVTRPGEAAGFTRDGEEVSFTVLTDSERAAIVLVAEVLRSATGESLVLIDTIERSIAPSAVEALLAALPRISPRAQFLVTTRLDAVPGAHQRLHLTRPRRS